MANIKNIIFNSDSWLGSFTSNLFSEVLVVVLLGFFVIKWIEKVQQKKERRENHKVIASLISAELEYNREQAKKLIENTPKGNVIFPALLTSSWDSVEKPDFMSFYKPRDLAMILSIYERIKSINRMYDSLLEASNWAVSGSVVNVREKFVNIFIDKCNDLVEVLDDFFAGVERKRKIKEEGLKYKGILVKKKPKFFGLLPWLSSYTAQAIYPYIFVSEVVYEDLTLIRSQAKNVAVLEHEAKHIERQKKIGVVKFGFKYLFSPKFRLNEELLAIKASMKYLKNKGLDVDIDRKAKFLSSWLYLWMISYDDALEKLEKMWGKINKD